MFTGQRELLACTTCGLTEDVDCTGRLLTVQPDAPHLDTGLRFRNLGRERFRCPACGAVVPEPEPPSFPAAESASPALPLGTHSTGAKA